MSLVITKDHPEGVSLGVHELYFRPEASSMFYCRRIVRDGEREHVDVFPAPWVTTMAPATPGGNHER